MRIKQERKSLGILIFLNVIYYIQNYKFNIILIILYKLLYYNIELKLKSIVIYISESFIEQRICDDFDILSL